MHIASSAANDPTLPPVDPQEDPINDPGNEDPGSGIDEPDTPIRPAVPPHEPDRPQRPVQDPGRSNPEKR